MIKIILLAIAVWLVITVLKGYLKNLEVPSESTDRSKKINQEKSESEDMVQCAYCGVHHPISNSFLIKNQYYCSKAHSSATHSTPPKP